MRRKRDIHNYDSIPVNYPGALCCVCIFGLIRYIAPSLDASQRILTYFMYAGILYGLSGCFWHYRLDESGITQYYLGFRDRQMLWKNAEAVGILYSTTYAKGNGQKYIVIIPKLCELPDLNRYDARLSTTYPHEITGISCGYY